jgi:hypothetical protein
MRLAEQGATTFTGRLGRLGTAIRQTVVETSGMRTAFRDAEAGAVRFETSIGNVVRRFEQSHPALVRFERDVARVAGGIGLFARSALNADSRLVKFDSTTQRVGNTVGLLFRSLTSVNFMFLAIVGAVSLLPGALAGVSGGVVALTGGVTALAAALSSLSAVAVARRVRWDRWFRRRHDPEASDDWDPASSIRQGEGRDRTGGGCWRWDGERRRDAGHPRGRRNALRRLARIGWRRRGSARSAV